jgi:hypothetical protein
LTEVVVGQVLVNCAKLIKSLCVTGPSDFVLESLQQRRDDLPIFFVALVWLIQAKRGGAFAQLRAAGKPDSSVSVS